MIFDFPAAAVLAAWWLSGFLGFLYACDADNRWQHRRWPDGEAKRLSRGLFLLCVLGGLTGLVGAAAGFFCGVMSECQDRHRDNGFWSWLRCPVFPRRGRDG